MTKQTSATPVELTAEYRARAAVMEDAPRATDFFNLCEIDEFGEPDYDLGEVVEEWSKLDLEHDVVLVETVDGEIVASMTFLTRGVGVFDISGYVHPEHRNRGLGSFIFDRGEQRALDRRPDGDPDSPLIVRNWFASNDRAAASLATARGYHHAKRFVRMAIELQSEPEVKPLPDGIELRPLDIETDLPSVFTVYEESFAEHWTGGAPRLYEQWKESSLGYGFEPRLWMLAYRGERLVGVSLGLNFPDSGWIRTVGVLKEERGRGLATALLTLQFGEFWRLGTTKIGLGVDSENTTGALDLYLKAGMHVSRSFDAWEKHL